MHALGVGGGRPNYVKSAAVIPALEAVGVRAAVVLTDSGGVQDDSARAAPRRRHRPKLWNGRASQRVAKVLTLLGSGDLPRPSE